MVCPAESGEGEWVFGPFVNAGRYTKSESLSEQDRVDHGRGERLELGTQLFWLMLRLGFSPQKYRFDLHAPRPLCCPRTSTARARGTGDRRARLAPIGPVSFASSDRWRSATRCTNPGDCSAIELPRDAHCPSIPKLPVAAGRVYPSGKDRGSAAAQRRGVCASYMDWNRVL